MYYIFKNKPYEHYADRWVSESVISQWVDEGRGKVYIVWASFYLKIKNGVKSTKCERNDG